MEERREHKNKNVKKGNKIKNVKQKVNKNQNIKNKVKYE